MFFLIITLCISSAMNDCQVESTGHFYTLRQCEVMEDIHRQVLGSEKDNNYRLECEYWEG